MIETKRCYVKSGAERWDYDLNPPQCEVFDYWVMLGEQKIFNFPYYEDALDYANKLNNAIDSVNKTYRGKK